MNWFTASVFFRAEAPSQQDGVLWEESILLIGADSAEMANSEAQRIGLEKQHSYTNGAGEKIDWVFVSVERVFELGDAHLGSGMEVFSRFLRPEEALSLLTPMPD